MSKNEDAGRSTAGRSSTSVSGINVNSTESKSLPGPWRKGSCVTSLPPSGWLVSLGSMALDTGGSVLVSSRCSAARLALRIPCWWMPADHPFLPPQPLHSFWICTRVLGEKADRHVQRSSCPPASQMPLQKIHSEGNPICSSCVHSKWFNIFFKTSLSPTLWSCSFQIPEYSTELLATGLSKALACSPSKWQLNVLLRVLPSGWISSLHSAKVGQWYYESFESTQIPRPLFFPTNALNIHRRDLVMLQIKFTL